MIYKATGRYAFHQIRTMHVEADSEQAAFRKAWDEFKVQYGVRPLTIKIEADESVCQPA